MRAAILVLPALSLLGVLASAQPAAAVEAGSAMIEQSRYLESFDGTRLAVSVFRPARDGRPLAGRLPVIVTQDRSEAGERARIRQFFVERGYIVVAQDRRGTGASFGTQVGFVTREDLRDAKAVIEWAAAQDFSTGAVGTMGCSNQGVWQYGVAALHPQGLKAIAPACASPAFFDDAVTLNGVPMFELRTAGYDGACAPAGGEGPRPSATPRPVDTDRDGALLQQALATRGCAAPMLGQYWLNMPRDGWNAFGVYRPAIDETPISHWREIKDSNVAILQIGGWFDAAVAGQLQGQHLWGGRLIMGPWVHGNRTPPEGSFPVGQLDLNAEMLGWFDHFLKGKSEAPRPGIDYYVVNAAPGREWRHTAGWPPSEGSKTAFYLAPDGLLAQPPPGRSPGRRFSGAGVDWFNGDYAPLRRWWEGDMASSNAGSLVHTTEPLRVDTEMTGTPMARLWIASGVSDLNVYAVIEDVAPDGRSTYVTDGRLRASWRALADMPWGGLAQSWHRGFAGDLQALEPGKPTELMFDFFPTAYVFRAGHRISVALSTANGDAYQQPPSAGGKIPAAVLLQDPDHRSTVVLPFVNPDEVERFPPAAQKGYGRRSGRGAARHSAG